MPSTQRGYVAGNFGLELNGVNVGWLTSAEGGDAHGEVVEERLGPDDVVRKHLAGVRYGDMVITCGVGMDAVFYEWLAAVFDRKYQRRDGAIVAMDYDYKAVSRLSFSDALVNEISFPKLDAASKDPAKLTIAIAPEYTRRVAASGPAVGKQPSVRTQKKWLPANFRIRIDGLDCSRVSKIEPLVVKVTVVESAVGEQRDYQKEPARVEISDLVVTLAESHAGDWLAWHEDFVIKGNSSAEFEKKGTLEFLTPDLKSTLFTLNFTGLGIHSLEAEKLEAGSESIRRLRAALYCEDMTFSYAGAVAGGTAAPAGTSTGSQPAPPPPPPAPPSRVDAVEPLERRTDPELVELRPFSRLRPIG